jgi:hypothetical protein
MGYEETRQHQERVADAIETATNAAAEIKVWLNRNPEVRDILANYSVIYSYFQNDLESIDQDSLDDCWNNHPKFKEALALWPNEQEEKDTLSDRIIELMRPGTSPTTLQAEKAKHRYMSVVSLRITAQELQERSELHKKSTAELRAIIQRPEPDKELPREISAAQIRRLWTPENFRFWAKKLGSMEPITRRLNEK